MTWKPKELPQGRARYLAIADALAHDVESGRLPPGERLPAQRELAQVLGVNVGTVTRAYAEARRRGLLDGEVGRGTFVRRQGSGGEFQSDEVGAQATIDLAFNLPAGGPSAGQRRAALEHLARREDLGPCFEAYHTAGLFDHRAAAAAWLQTGGLEASAGRVLVTGGAQHALAVCLASLTEAGDEVLAEEITYPGIKALAGLLNRRLRGVAIDEHGIVPEAFDEACARSDAKLLYCMPSMHNPTGTVLPEERRQEIARIARGRGVIVIEDDTYGFLCEPPPPPIAAFAPERTYHVSSLSKCLGPGLRVGYLLAPTEPAGIFDQLVNSSSAMTWMAAPLMGELASLWIRDGTLEAVSRAKRAEARARQALARRLLGCDDTVSDPGSCHLWLPLPEPWSAREFARRALEQNVAVTEPSPFVASDPATPRAVRLCLSTPPARAMLERGVEVLASILALGPQRQTAIV
jgi:DNA-binding transcriptional MocR family regulator